MTPEKYLKWHQSLFEFGKLNKASPQIVKRPSVGSEIEYYFLSMGIPFGNSKIDFSQGASLYGNFVGFSKVQLSYSYVNSRTLELSLSRSDFFDLLFFRRIIKTGSEEFDKVFTIRGSDKTIALLIFKDRIIQELFLQNNLLIFNISTTRSRITTITLKSMEEKCYSLSEVAQLLENFKMILNKILK